MKFKLISSMSSLFIKSILNKPSNHLGICHDKSIKQFRFGTKFCCLISEFRLLVGDGVLFVERSSELLYTARLSGKRHGAVVKARVNRPN